MAPVTQILFVSIKPGKIDEFVEADRNFIASATLPKGLVGSRLYKSPNGKSAVRVLQYESIEAHQEYQRDPALQHQGALLRDFVESTTPSFYEEVRTTGDFKWPASLAVAPGTRLSVGKAGPTRRRVKPFGMHQARIC